MNLDVIDIDNYKKKLTDLQELLLKPETSLNKKKYIDTLKKIAKLNNIIKYYHEYLNIKNSIQENIILTHQNYELKILAEEEIEKLLITKKNIEKKLKSYINTNNNYNVFLEIRAATGGHESSIFAKNLFRMYIKYAELKKWNVEIISENINDYGGYKEIIAKIKGRDVYNFLKFESGSHRVQRIPITESQGRIHTSTCTVAVIPEKKTKQNFDIKMSDIKIDTFKASGAGGQHVNKTDSAVRITHIPSKIVVECQQGRSQHQNKNTALSLLQAKLIQKEENKIISMQKQERKLLIGSGDRSERIRTYNYPQNRITDHRINFTSHNFCNIMEGQLDDLIINLINKIDEKK